MNIVEQTVDLLRQHGLNADLHAEELARILDDAGVLAADPPDDGEIMAVRATGNNSAIIEDLFRLGYLNDDMAILDATYGNGTFWKRHRPPYLITNDINPSLDTHTHCDFTDMGDLIGDEATLFDAVVFDPDYKMQGTSSNAGPASSNAAYGMDREYRPVDAQLGLIGRGLAECVRVCKRRGVIAVKCMDQIVSGAPVWQTDRITRTMDELGCDKIAEFMLLGHRKQPTHDQCPACKGKIQISRGCKGECGEPTVHIHMETCQRCDGSGKVPRRQVHERRNYSTMLIFKKG